ncbi:MAG: DUF2891 domain-containing protein [Planctomycetaceae bacterium]
MASAFARTALANVSRPYPHKLDHLLVDGPELWAADHVAVHPAFCGAYDWHSAVHMHWLLVRVLRLAPASPEAAAIVATLDAHLTSDALAAERRYLASAAGKTFERPYGWAWLLALQAELERLRRTDSRADPWAGAVAPLAGDLAERLGSFVAVARYPVRAGTHGNTAFACILAHDHAVETGDAALAATIAGAVIRWHGADRIAPVAYEPSLTDFLSPTLAVAAAMAFACSPAAFAAWFDAYLPEGLGPLATPPWVDDRRDPQIAHLDGLSLSRAWMLRRIAAALPAGHARRRDLVTAADRHLEAGMPWTVGGDYAGEHWLASFAALAVGDRP